MPICKVFEINLGYTEIATIFLESRVGNAFFKLPCGRLRRCFGKNSKLQEFDLLLSSFSEKMLRPGGKYTFVV